MLIQPIDIFVYAWLIVAALSAAYVAWDQFRGNPEPSVMNSVMADKERKPGAHEEFVKPLWKQGVGSTVHGYSQPTSARNGVSALLSLSINPVTDSIN